MMGTAAASLSNHSTLRTGQQFRARCELISAAQGKCQHGKGKDAHRGHSCGGDRITDGPSRDKRPSLWTRIKAGAWIIEEESYEGLSAFGEIIERRAAKSRKGAASGLDGLQIRASFSMPFD